MEQKRQHWTQLKKERVELLGGKCELCGYNKCLDALVFHHKDTSIKEREKDWAASTFKKENYILVCANCHAEIHNSMRGHTFQTFKENFIPEQTLERKETTP